MPSSDYTSAVGGGLKLKGSGGAGIEKKRKKTKKKKQQIIADDAEGTTQSEKDAVDENPGGQTLEEALAEEDSATTKIEAVAREKATTRNDGKTEAERRYEERRRKRLDERLQREGVQTHKERVERLNKYLSGLSEHHDMPRIGPG